MKTSLFAIVFDVMVVRLLRCGTRWWRSCARWVGVSALAVVVVPALAYPVVVTDDQGRQVNVVAAPQRIVTLLPSLAETVCELGHCSRLVGVDRFTQWPASIARLPRVGGGLDPDIEAIVALRPDLVLTSGSGRVAQRLQALGLTVIALEPRTLADTRRVLKEVSRVLTGSDRDGTLAWVRLETGVGNAAQSIPPRSRGGTVYFEVGSGPYAAGEASFIGELIARLGARSIVPAALGPFPKINPEFVVRADPGVILIAADQAAGLASRPGWAGLRAVREARVCAFSPAEGDVLVRAGPRLAEAARLLASCLASKAPTLPTVAPGAMPPAMPALRP